MERFSIILLALVGCDAGTPPSRAHPAAPASPLVVRALGIDGLEARAPDDAGIFDLQYFAPDDGGTHVACVVLHGAMPAGEQREQGVCVQPDDMAAGPRANTLEADRARILAAGNVTITREVRISDGNWVVETRHSDPDSSNALLELFVHRTFNFRSWECTVRSRSRSELAEAEALCRSLDAPIR